MVEPRFLPGMAWSLRRFLLIRLTGATLLVSLTGLASAAEGDTEITAVVATVHNGYERVKEADGSFKPETYSFGEGGFSGIPTKDKSVDEQSFRKIAGTIAPVLARQGYVPSFDADENQLLIFVYWGTTGTEQNASGGYDPGPGAITSPPPPPPVVSGGPGGTVVSASPPPVPTHDTQQTAFDAMTSARNRARDRDNFRNARILGYDELLAQQATRPSGRGYQDLVEEIEDPRYFVVLRAYDFQLLRKEKKQKLLWEVRYSLRARDHLFDESLGAMTDAAARYFGQASNGLVRRQVPVGRVRLAEPVYEFLPGEPEKK
jgi:hypothetical protein